MFNVLIIFFHLTECMYHFFFFLSSNNSSICKQQLTNSSVQQKHNFLSSGWVTKHDLLLVKGRIIMKIHPSFVMYCTELVYSIPLQNHHLTRTRVSLKSSAVCNIKFFVSYGRSLIFLSTDVFP